MSSYHAPSNPVPTPGDAIEAKPPAQSLLLRSTLTLEAVVVVFAALVAHGLRLANLGVIWGVTAVLVVLLLGLGRTMDQPRMRVVASVAQLLILAIGFAVPMMFLVGGVFVLLWIASIVIGRKIDRERAQWDAEHPELAPNVT